jgi:hypothetical protein
MARVEHGLVLVDVNRCHSRAPVLQRGDQRAGLDELGSADVTSSAVGFILARSPAVTMPRVASTRRMWSEITSQSEKNASLLGATV